MKHAICVMHTCLPILMSNAAYAELDQICAQIADDSAKTHVEKNIIMMKQLGSASFELTMAMVTAQQESGFQLVHQVTAVCLEMAGKNSKISDAQAKQLATDVFERMNAELGLPTNSGPGSAG